AIQNALAQVVVADLLSFNHIIHRPSEATTNIRASKRDASSPQLKLGAFAPIFRVTKAAGEHKSAAPVALTQKSVAQ
ncbi:MAG: hypothetical protein ACUVSU_15350, partial [Aggregatilineaceae bacterium]